MSQIFSEKDKQLVQSAIKKAETQTHAEIVVQVVPRSSCYVGIHALGALMGFVLSGLAYWMNSAWHVPSIAEMLSVQVMSAVSFVLVTLVPGLKRFMILDRFEVQAVDQKAKLAFLEMGVTRTKNRSGILIFFSEFERRVEILGDVGVADAFPWEELSKRLARAVSQKKATEVLCEMIEEMGKELSQLRPEARGVVAENELSDDVR